MKRQQRSAIWFAGMTLFVFSTTVRAEDPFEKLRKSTRQATENAKRSWEESRSKREEAARRLRESTRRATENAKRSWEQGGA